jgi:hypothetical protein
MGGGRLGRWGGYLLGLVLVGEVKGGEGGELWGVKLGGKK